MIYRELLCDAFSWVLRWKRGSLGDSWSLLSRAEAQVQLNASEVQYVLYLQPVPATEKTYRLVSHF